MSNGSQIPNHILLNNNLNRIIPIELIGFFTLITNGLLAYTILSRRHLRKATNIIIASMAIGSIIFAIFYCFLFPLEILSSKINSIFCHLFGPFRNFCLSQLSLHLSLVSLEKYVVIAHPFRCARIVTKTNIALSLAVVWVGAFLLSFLPVPILRKYHPVDRLCPIAGDPEAELIYFICFYIFAFLFPLLIMLFAYGSICRIALKHMQDIHVKRPKDASADHDVRKRIHAAKPLVIMVGAFFILWLPYVIATIIIFVYARNLARFIFIFPLYDYTELYQAQRNILLPISLSYCAINPIIYGYLNPSLRRAFTAMITCKPNNAYGGGTSITSVNNDTSYKSNWNRSSTTQTTKA